MLFIYLFTFILKASDRFLRVAGSEETIPIPRRGQGLSAESLQDPPIFDYLGGAHTAITADRERQDTVRENLGLRDAVGLAVGQHFSLKTANEERRLTRWDTQTQKEVPPSWAATTQKVFQMQSGTCSPADAEKSSNVLSYLNL